VGTGPHKIIDLADILQSLGNKRWTGTLQVISHTRNNHLFFREGIIHHSKSDSAHRIVLGRALFKLGKLDEADLNRAVTHEETSGKKIGEACVELGFVTEDDIRDALNFQARESILDLFTWEDVDARFNPGEPPPLDVFTAEDLDVKLGLSPMGLLMEAARRADEWEMVKVELPTPNEVVAFGDDGRDLPENADRRLLALVDGYRMVGEIADAAPIPNFEALKQLADLTKNGTLRRLEAIELAKVALEAEKEQELEKALKLYQLAQGRGLGDRLDLAKRIARVYLLVGQSNQSLELWLGLAERCEAERPDQAIEAYRAALAIDPVRLEALEKLARLLVATDRRDEAAAHLRRVIELLSAAEVRNLTTLIRAHNELLEIVPDDESALRTVAELHVDDKDRVHAIVRYDELAQLLVARGALEDAIAAYYRVLEIDEECLEGRLALAQCLAKLGSTDDAVREYRRLADTLQRSGLIQNSINWPFLIKVYESIVELEPSSTPAWEWLAKAYHENGQNDLSVSRWLGMAQSLEPKDETQKPPQELLLPLKKVLELEPRRTDVQKRLARVYLALDKTPEAVTTLFELARSQARAGASDAALEALDEALHADPFHLDSRRLEADLHDGAGRKERAFEAWSALGGICLRAGLNGEASDAYRRALAIEPTDPLSLQECARADERRGRFTDAAALYTKLAEVELARENQGSAKLAQERSRELARLQPTGSSPRATTPTSPPPLPPMPPWLAK
jgi:tetratricopeptide (TPR) repeat protein